MKYLVTFLTAAVLILNSCSKKSENSISQPPNTGNNTGHHYNPYFTKYNNPTVSLSTVGLQLKFNDTAGRQQLLLYGNYAGDKTPKSLYFYQVVPDNNDTIFNYQLDDTLGLTYIYFTIKNQITPLPSVVKLSKTPAGLNYVGLFQRNWSTKSDSLIKEFYFNDNNQPVYSSRQAGTSSSLKILGFQTRDIYTKLGLSDDAIAAIQKYGPDAVKISAAILLASVTGGASGYILLARLAAAGLASWAVWSRLSDILNITINNASANEISYSTNYPMNLTQQTGGDFISKYPNITDAFGNIPPILLYQPQLAPDALTMNIVCNFICNIVNYRNGVFYMPAMGSNQLTDSSAFFFTKSTGNRFATLHKQRLQNVTIDNNNIVRGQVLINNVWPINQNWSVDSVRYYFQDVKFYSGAAIVGSGWGPISNLVPLLTQ